MSRINRARIVDGDDVTAASLNDRFDDFSQAGALDQFNTRDGAVDLPQLAKTGFQAPFMQVDDLGKSDLLHAAPVSDSAKGTTPGSFSVLQDGAANPTIATYTGGLSITTNDVLRVYWSLSVAAELSGTPWALGLQYNTITGTGGGGNLDVSTSAGCFAAWLQWDVTDATLTNWTEVPGQGDFQTLIGGGYYGNTLQNCGATTIIPLWSVWMRNVRNGDSSSGAREETRDAGWRGVSGSWHYVSGFTRTIYGLRVVILGVMHPYRATTGGTNALVHDIAPAGGVSLQYTGGRLVTMVNRIK